MAVHNTRANDRDTFSTGHMTTMISKIEVGAMAHFDSFVGVF
jgi:hypothetical protein